MIKSLLGKINNIYYGILNLKYYFNVIWKDRDYDYIFALYIMKRKLEKIENYLGTSSSYIGDYEDKIKLQKLINELDDFIEKNPSLDEKENSKICSNLFTKIGRLLPKLWD